jgi:hypothetical protein
MVTWDWQLGATREPLRPPRFWSASELTRTNGGQPQVFVPVTPTNHLGVRVADPRTTPVPAPPVLPSDDLHALWDRVDVMERQLALVGAQLTHLFPELATLRDDLNRLRLRRYKGTWGPFTIISTPE